MRADVPDWGSGMCCVPGCGICDVRCGKSSRTGVLFRVSIRSSCGLRCGDGSPIRPMLLSSSVSLCGHVCVLRVGGVYDVLRKWPGSMRRDFRRWIFSLYDERDEGVQFEMKLKAGGKARARARDRGSPV